MSEFDACFVRRLVRKASSLDDLRPASGVEDDGLLLKQRGRMGRQGSSLLHVAAYFGRVSVVEELLKKGFSLDDKNNLRWSSHHYLCRFHQPLNQKLSLGLKPKAAKQQSKSFRFTYFKHRRSDEES